MKDKRFKKILSLILALTMAITIIPQLVVRPAQAAESPASLPEITATQISTWAQLTAALEAQAPLIELTNNIIMEDTLTISSASVIRSSGNNKWELNGNDLYQINISHPSAELNGLTITRLRGKAYACIYIEKNGGAINNCIIVNNIAKNEDNLQPRLIFMYDAVLSGNLIINNTVYENKGSSSGGSSIIHAEHGSSLIIGNTIARNKIERVNNEDSVIDNTVSPSTITINNALYDNRNQNMDMLLDIRIHASYPPKTFSNYTGYADGIFNQPTVSLSDSAPVYGAFGSAAVSYDYSLKTGENNPLYASGSDVYAQYDPCDLNETPRRSYNGKCDIGAYSAQTVFVDPNESVHEGPNFFVKTNGSGNKSGKNWLNAMSSPVDAVDAAVRYASKTGKAASVFIAGGTYDIQGRVLMGYDKRTKRTGAAWVGVVLAEGVAIYGGFSGDESSSDYNELINSRAKKGGKGAQVYTNVTTFRAVREDGFNPDYLDLLNGGTNVGSKPISRSSRGVRPISIFNMQQKPLFISGIAVENGYIEYDEPAFSSAAEWYSARPGYLTNMVGGGGMLLHNATVENCTFEKNYEALKNHVGGCGGGLFLIYSRAVNCVVKNNIAETRGGGIAMEAAELIDCEITNNIAFDTGGGIVTAHDENIHIGGGSLISNCLIEGNASLGLNRNGRETDSTVSAGGGIWAGGGIVIENSIIANNKANSGAGIYLGTIGGLDPALINNTLIKGNSAAETATDPSAIYMERGKLVNTTVISDLPVIHQDGEIINTVIWGNGSNLLQTLKTENITYSAFLAEIENMDSTCISLTAGNTAANGPHFIDPYNGNYALEPSSPLIDAGNNAAIPAGTDKDLNGNTRIENNIVNIGAFENLDIPDDDKLLIAATGSKTNINYYQKLIYGLDLNLDNLNNYIKAKEGYTFSLTKSSAKVGSASTVAVKLNGQIVDTYTVVILGDVDGDAQANGADLVLVNCLINGMLTREQVGGAVYSAADCNHDGLVNSLDVDLLDQAGLLIKSINQLKTQ